MATDRLGATIAVGDTVKLVGVVTAINDNDPHFAGVIILPSYPAGGFIPAINVTSPGPARSNPQIPANYAFDGSQLTKGS